MPVIAAASFFTALLAAMVSFNLLTGTPSPIDGFDWAMNRNPKARTMFSTVSVVITITMIVIFAYSMLSIRSNRDRPYLTMAITVAYAFLFAMLLGIIISGYTHERQLVVFESICFLVAGLFVMVPAVSLIYFIMANFLFAATFSAGGFLTESVMLDIVYIGIVDIVVSWVIYALFSKYIARERAIAEQSRRDELTGAKNRHYLRDDFPSYVGKSVFVMLCDIDNFKSYNDGYNHAVGDYLLQQFYYALREVFGDECTYRYGGDEFLVITHEALDEELKRKAERVGDQLREVTFEDNSFDIAFSGGFVKGTPKNQAAIRDMMHGADKNLLEAKRQGKNRVVG